MSGKGCDRKNIFGGDDGDDGRLIFKRRISPCGKSTWHSEVRSPVSYDDADDFDDNVPLSERLSRMSNLGTWGSSTSNCNVPVKKRRTTTMPVKRPFDNSNLSRVDAKKLKRMPCDMQGKEEDDIPLMRRSEMPGKSADKSFSSLKKELALVEKSFEECQRKRQLEEKKLEGIKRDIEERSKELGEMKKEIIRVEGLHEYQEEIQGKIEECVKDLLAKEAQLCLMEDLIADRKQELRTKEIEHRQVMEEKECELKGILQEIAECNVEVKTKEKEIGEMKKLMDELAAKLESERKKLLKVMQLTKTEQHAQAKAFESTKKQFEERVNELALKEKRCEEQRAELELNENLLEGRVKEIELKEKELEGQKKECTSKMARLRDQMKGIASKNKHFYSRVKEFEMKEEKFECQVKELKLKAEKFEGQVKEFEVKEEKFEGQVKEFELEKKHLECRAKELQSKEKFLDDRVKAFRASEEELEGRKKEFESKEEEFEAQMQELKRFVTEMEDLKSEKKHFKGRGKELESKETKFNVHLKKMESKETQFDGSTMDLESKPDTHDEQLKQHELGDKQYYALTEAFNQETEPSNQLTPTIDEHALMLLPDEQTDEFESSGNDVQVNLRTTPDPSKVVLQIIKNPTMQKCKMGDDVVIVNSHILLLEELRKISPHIRPDVREEAMKVAHNLKASMKENNENSNVVLHFLLFLSVYGLVPSFDKDEILKLFGLVSQHNIAVELFGDMGFADKISG